MTIKFERVGERSLIQADFYNVLQEGIEKLDLEKEIMLCIINELCEKLGLDGVKLFEDYRQRIMLAEKLRE
jgi:hypothetical protein